MRRMWIVAAVAGCGGDTLLTVRDDPPRVTIVRPVDLTSFDPATPVELCALVEDEDDAEVLRVGLESSAAGPLEGGFAPCEGGNWSGLLTLTQVPHVLVVTAVDTRGQSGAAAVTVVPEGNQAPFCTWIQPTDGAAFTADDVVSVSIAVGDPEVDASTLRVQVSSSRDGVLFDDAPPSNGQLRIPLADLTAGAHRLDALVVDPRGRTAGCGAAIRVDPCVDGDGDEVTACAGDCDDADPLVRPGAAERPNGDDDDCDGITDEGTVVADDDGDGFTELEGDCDDADPDRAPGVDDPPYDDVDADCDGAPERDRDGDGHDAIVAGGDDCEDTDAAVRPGAREQWYDGVDQDCSGGDDFDRDADGDRADFAGGTDCDDLDPEVYAEAAEVWYDGVDQDCSGGNDFDRDGDAQASAAYGGSDCDDDDPTVYRGAVDAPYDGVDADCDGGDDDDADRDGFRARARGGADCDDTDPFVRPGVRETWYDGIDQDCSGGSDHDRDGDGYTVAGAPDGTADDCDDGRDDVRPGAPETWYDGVDQDCGGGNDYDADGDGQPSDAFRGADCDDTDPTVYRGAVDAPYDGVDADCDGGDDDDADRDGFRARARGGTDCDDTDPFVRPGARETWYDGIDQDCSGGSDYDRDRDGYTLVGAPSGTRNDCDDGRSDVFPGASETWYDGVDQDCGGGNDYDADSDGQASSAFGGSDCNDRNPAIRFGAVEVWYDGIDQDCDGLSDHDRDRDGYTRLGAPDGTADDCDDSPLGYGTNPGAREIWYDGIDSDCSGGSDFDRDGDGDLSAAYGGDDCDDTVFEIGPGAPEIANGADDDCDGLCDEGVLGAGSLVITEIMRDPDAVPDLRGEWFEVHNPTAGLVRMCGGWSVVGGAGEQFDVRLPVEIAPGGYVVFARNGDPTQNGGVTSTYTYGSALDLGNNSDEIAIFFDGLLIDRVNYASSGWPATGGRSMELDRDFTSATLNDSGSRWCNAPVAFGAGDRGSPGRVNNGCP